MYTIIEEPWLNIGTYTMVMIICKAKRMACTILKNIIV